METASRLIVILALAAASCTPSAHAIQDADLKWRPAIEVILSAFEGHPLVALNDGAGHGELQTRDLFTAIVRDPRFPAIVRNIVVEFGNSRYQEMVDRYVSGAPIPRDDLRHVWEDTTQVTGVWSVPMYEQMLAEVRSVNAGLPSARRMRVLLGDPPIDWTVVTSPADEDMNDWRDAHFAHVIDAEVMRRQQRALILIGGAHIDRRVIFPNSLIHLLDARFPAQTAVIGVLDAERVDAEIKMRLDAGTLPGGSFVRNTWLGKVDVQRIGFGLSKGIVEDDVDGLLLLTLGPLQSQEPLPLDPAYAIELARRRALAAATLPFRGAKIRFQENAAALVPDAGEPMHAVLRELLRDRGLKLLVKAFSDRAELDADALSARRADLVAEWLTSRGIARGRLIPKGCGARRALTFGTTAAERAMNRRAELVRLTSTAACDPPW